MSSGVYGSEEALATLACRRVRTLKQPCVLIGGLGMGFTLRAALDFLPPDAMVVVAELVPTVVEWNQGPLGPLARHPLKVQSLQRLLAAQPDPDFLFAAGDDRTDEDLFERVRGERWSGANHSSIGDCSPIAFSG
jgi:Trehalose-phosphatase